MKKISRKIEKNSVIDEATRLEKKISPKKILVKEREKYPKKTKTIEISKAEIAQDVEQEKAMAEEPLPLLAEEPLPSLVKAIVESPMQEISKRKRRKKVRKKRPKPVIFRLTKPCKVICKPDICCRRTAFRKTRYDVQFNKMNINFPYFLIRRIFSIKILLIKKIFDGSFQHVD